MIRDLRDTPMFGETKNATLEVELASSTASDLFDQAEAYLLSALALERAKVPTYLSLLPIRNLYYTSVELYLKTYLRIHGHSIDELEGKFRRDFRRMRKRCKSLGLHLGPDDERTIEYFVRTPTSVRTKYSSTRYYSAPPVEQLADLCRSLSGAISAQLNRVSTATELPR